MKKIAGTVLCLILLLFVCVLSFVSCRKDKDKKEDEKTPVGENYTGNVIPTEPPTQMVTNEAGKGIANIPLIDSKIDTGYKKLDDVNVNAVSEIRLDKAANEIFEIGDTLEFYSYISTQKTDDTYTIKIMKYGADGMKLWERSYLETTYIGVIWFSTDKFGNFAFATSENIIFCDYEGNIKSTDINIYDEMLWIVFTKDNEVVTAGTTSADEGYTDIRAVVKKYNKDRKLTERRELPEGDRMYLQALLYSEKSGLLLIGDVPAEGQPDDSTGFTRFIKKIDEITLEVVWEYYFDNEFGFIYFDMEQDDRYFYMGIYSPAEKEGEAVYLFKIDTDSGSEVWRRKISDENYVYCFYEVLKNGNIAVAVSNKLIILDKDGNTLKSVEGPEYEAYLIKEMSDGSLLISTPRKIKSLPQPAYVSSMWFDWETVITRLDADLKIIWRKTYDDQKNAPEMEYIYPRSDNAMLLSPR